MSRSSDVPAEMTHPGLDDATAERLLRGRPVPGRPELDEAAALVARVRRLADAPPAPGPQLAALLREGFDPAQLPAAAAEVPDLRVRRRRRLAAVAGMSLGLKVLAGTGVAMAGVGTAGTAGLLPDAVSDRVAAVVRGATPFLDEAPQPQPPAAPAEGERAELDPAGTPPVQQLPPLPERAADTAESTAPPAPPAGAPARRPAAPAPDTAPPPAPERPAAPGDVPADRAPEPAGDRAVGSAGEPAAEQPTDPPTPAPARGAAPVDDTGAVAAR